MRQDHTITIDVPTFRDRNEIVVRTSDNTVELRAQNTNTSFYRKPSCDNSHLDWYGTDNEEGSSANSHVQNNEEKSESRLINKKHNGAIIVQENTVIKGSSRRNGWSFESVWGGSSDTDEENPHLSSNGSGIKEKVIKTCFNRFRSHGRMLLSCIVALIVLSASIGVLVLIIPLWVRSEERGESGEVGGLSYGEGDGVLLDNSNIDGVVLPAAASSAVVLEPPPYNLNIICKQQSLLEEGGYDRCVSACLPSRCCLLDESEQYEVWTTWHIGANNASDDKEIGKFISSCFNENENICIRYNQGCSILGKHVLLPVKPPLDTAVMVMNNSQKLQLAETIIRACSSTSEGANGEGLGECQAFCEAKECCFLKDTNEDEAIVDSGSITSENNGRNTQQTDYCGDDPQSFCLLYAGCEQYLQEHRNNGERKE